MGRILSNFCFSRKKRESISLTLNQPGSQTKEQQLGLEASQKGSKESQDRCILCFFLSWRRGYLSGTVQMRMTPDGKVVECVRALSPLKDFFRLVWGET
ncbi:hypothetical protein NPIL_494181 [Nephila pilipes]|uniref:Uncharacterized protein n=1 Tax=Nephila pilipes TaxID=299642 RepID=A0A8X6NU02_NEPPI|nr:hypothetical protein NPIL_494181 [Nephila pilipes]